MGFFRLQLTKPALSLPSCGTLFATAFLLIVGGGLFLPQNACAKEEAIAWKKDLKQAILQARKEKKPVLIRVEADWCPHCAKMALNTFQERSLANDIERSFIPVVLDADESPEIIKALGVTSLPATVLITPELKVLERVNGFKKKHEYTKRIEEHFAKEESEKEAEASTKIANGSLNTISWSSDLKAAALQAKKSNQKILLRFEADWCGFCKKMTRDTFGNSNVIRKVNSSFIPVVLDADQHADVMKVLKVKSLPTTVVLSPELDTLETIKGYQNPENFQKLIASHVVPSAQDTQVAKKESESKVFGFFQKMKPGAEKQQEAKQPAAPRKITSPKTVAKKAPKTSPKTSPKIVPKKAPKKVAQANTPPQVSSPKVQEEKFKLPFMNMKKKAPKKVAATAKPAAKPAPASPRVASAKTKNAPAFGGICIVSVVRDAKVNAGSSFYSTEHQGQKLWFASKEHRNAFLADPNAFFPQNEGVCPVTAVNTKKPLQGQPAYAVRFKNKIHFCKNRDAAMSFLESPDRYVDFQIEPTRISSDNAPLRR